METTDNIVIGQIVKSKAGRDKGRTFIIVDILDDKYVMVADGDLRRIDSPKRKKIKHLIVFKSIIKDYKEKVDNKVKVNNAYLRKVLEPFKKEI